MFNESQFNEIFNVKIKGDDHENKNIHTARSAGNVLEQSGHDKPAASHKVERINVAALAKIRAGRSD